MWHMCMHESVISMSDVINLDDVDDASLTEFPASQNNNLDLKYDDINKKYDEDFEFPPLDLDYYESALMSPVGHHHPGNSEVIKSPVIPATSTKFRDKSIAKNGTKTKKSSKISATAKHKKSISKEKIMKKIADKQRKNIQPGECMKFIEVDMNNDIKRNFNFYQETVSMLESASVTFSTNSSGFLPNNCITWKRIIEEYSITDDNELNTTIRKQNEDHVLIIWKWDEAVKQIYNETFLASVESIYNLMPQKKLTLVIYGIECYFNYYKHNKKEKSYSDIEMENIPKISRKDFELSLIDIQLNNNCNTRLIENSSDMSLLIYQYTKSIAEKTFKLETRNRLYDQIDFFAAGDNKKTVKVDQYGYGLKKLWLKQLSMFNTSSLSIAEAISSVHPSPLNLINSCMNCSSMESGHLLLRNIQIKNASSGPLARARKLGPELSRKIYTMYTSTDGQQLLD